MLNTIPPSFPLNETVQNDVLDYAFEIEYFGKQLNKILDHLETKGMLENTLVIVTSDNGMPFPRVKGQVYPYDHHLPLAIRWGKGIKKPGRVIDQFVSFTDIAPSILSVAQVAFEESSMHPMEGKNWQDYFNNRY